MTRKNGPAAGSSKPNATSPSKAKTPAAAPAARSATNPLLAPWKTPFEVPPFDRIKVEHFGPAFDAAFAQNVSEIASISFSY